MPAITGLWFVRLEAVGVELRDDVPYLRRLTGVSFFSVSWGGVRLSPLGTAATNWPLVAALDDR
jgi:hypothetical protein